MQLWMTTVASARGAARTAQEIDDEVHSIIDSEQKRAREYLTNRRPSLDRIATELLRVETLERGDLEKLANAVS